jgi:glycosyltransferase involved in cell wall biosynthesis
VRRVLYISSASPVPSTIGPARRNYHVLKQLTRYYDVTLLSPGTAADAALFASQLGSSVASARFVPAREGRRRKVARKIWRTATSRCDFTPTLEPALRQACAELGREEAFDAIVLSSVFLRGLPLPEDVPIIGDTHNVEFDVLRRIARDADSPWRRLYARAQLEPTRREEGRVARAVDLLLATSDRDRRVFEEELGAPNVELIPNAIDLAEFAFSERASTSPTILFPGLMSYYPNQQAVRWFLDRVFPLIVRQVPESTFVIAGAAPPRWMIARAAGRVVVTGAVADMRPYLEQASLCVVPLLMGGGTRVKILEAQAFGRPVVSTTVGAEGIHAREEEAILIADEPEAFARRVVDVLTNPELAARLAVGGRRFVVEHHDWDQIGVRLNYFVDECMERSVRRRSGSIALASR